MIEEQTLAQAQKITKRQFDEVDAMIDSALRDSNIDSDYNGEVKSLIRCFMAVAVQQKEERDFLFAELTKYNRPNLSPQ